MNTSEFFKDEASEYIFYLLHTDARVRCKLLNITEELYYDKSKAIEWYNNIYNKIISHNDAESVHQALDKLKVLYGRIMKAYEED